MADNGHKKEQVTLTIDGQEVTVDKGTTIIEAAQQIGIEIPYFCCHPFRRFKLPNERAQ